MVTGNDLIDDENQLTSVATPTCNIYTLHVAHWWDVSKHTHHTPMIRH